MSSSPLFSKRHYEWLAAWAGAHLTHEQTFDLSCSLSSADPQRRSKHELFMQTARAVRNRANIVKELTP